MAIDDEGYVTCDHCSDYIDSGRGFSHPNDRKHRELCSLCYAEFDASWDANIPRCSRCGSYQWLYEGDRQRCADCGR